MQSNVIAPQYNGEVYPQVIVGFDSDIGSIIGSVLIIQPMITSLIASPKHLNGPTAIRNP